MTDEGVDRGRRRVPWTGPEIAAVSILGAFGVVVVGGLATGIDVAASSQAPVGDTLAHVWDSISFGASWAGPLVAMFLLGVIGVCWWQADRWADEVGESEVAVAFSDRALHLATWVLGALGITVLGSVAALIATLGIVIPSHPPQIGWSRVIGMAAQTIAVIVIAVGGLTVVRDIRRTCSISVLGTA